MSLDYRSRIFALAEALDISARSVRNDKCGDPHIFGRDGHIYVDGAGSLIVCHPGAPLLDGLTSSAIYRFAG